VRAVAWTEPTTKVARFADGDAAEMSADTQHDQPFWLLDPLTVCLGVAEGFDSEKEKDVSTAFRRGREQCPDGRT